MLGRNFSLLSHPFGQEWENLTIYAKNWPFVKQAEIQAFLSDLPSRPVLDVRTPAEFDQGHIPGAFNLPLFTNDERAVVGTLYKQVSPEAAFLRGLDFAGAKMSWYVKEAIRICPSRKIAVHCWRGGKRSGSLATLLHFSGFDVTVLKGGYKAYRSQVLEGFAQQNLKFVVLGGKTGSGKTDVLHHLSQLGEQVLDLEAIARHKGSAFGSLGELPQPTVEQFENDLSEAIRQLDCRRRVWVENESRSIGRAFIPQGCWINMKSSPLIHLEVPLEQRVQRLVADYGHFPTGELEAALEKIERKLGGQHVKTAREALLAGDLETATKIALVYYDKSYLHATAQGNFSQTLHLEADMMDPATTARTLVELADQSVRFG